jgi:UDP-glucose 6-dehydrogenase
MANPCEGMKIACVGAGYVGGSTMAMMAKNCPGIKVTCIDINQARVDAWNSDELPTHDAHEPGLEPPNRAKDEKAGRRVAPHFSVHMHT